MAPQAFKSSRLYSIDVLRGLGALAVVVWHWQHFEAISGSWPPDWNRADQPFYEILKPLYGYGWMAVDIFFAVSGFVFFWLYLGPVAKRDVDCLLAVARLCHNPNGGIVLEHTAKAAPDKQVIID